MNRQVSVSFLFFKAVRKWRDEPQSENAKVYFRMTVFEFVVISCKIACTSDCLSISEPARANNV